MIEYILAAALEEYDTARLLFLEYAAAINVDLCFQNFDTELSDLESMYSAPNGGIILCKNDNDFVGCIGIRKKTDTVCEVKRMYVQPGFQNFGIGKALLAEALVLAKKYKYELARLDTLNHMLPAINLYKQNGFYEIAPYYHNPNKTALFFEKKL